MKELLRKDKLFRKYDDKRNSPNISSEEGLSLNHLYSRMSQSVIRDSEKFRILHKRRAQTLQKQNIEIAKYFLAKAKANNNPFPGLNKIFTDFSKELQEDCRIQILTNNISNLWNIRRTLSHQYNQLRYNIKD